MPDKDAHLRWKELSRRTIASGGIFDLFAADRMSHGGLRGEFWILEARDWVTVVPVIQDTAGEPCFIMVRQYRHGAETITTEFPAGLVEHGEDPRAAAERELLEETGFRAGRMTLIGSVSPNPAFMSNRCFTYLAEDLTRSGEKSLDPLEQLEAVEVPVPVVSRRIGTGELINSLVAVAFLWYTRTRATGGL